ncbi:hypothetical protein HK096_008940 [Nowakowskiella sp. JEL0078]|nr:hypothetical protein HK096_008940 [Nowakowskiella sp. JEL0078]
MTTSAIGLSAPFLIKRIFGTKLKNTGTWFQSLKLFGSGVILATAFVHMLVPAFQSLSDDCLPPFFNSDYGGWVGVFALFGVFFTHLIQMFARNSLLDRQLKKQNTDTEDKYKSLKDVEKQERHQSLFVLEMGIAVHSIIIGKKKLLKLNY